MPKALEYKQTSQSQPAPEPPKKTRKPRTSTKGVSRPKMPIPTFTDTPGFHNYLKTLTFAQLKKVARKLISQTKKELSVDLKRSTREQILEDLIDTFTYEDYGSGQQFLKAEVTTFRQHSMPEPKPRAPRKPKEDKADSVEPLKETDYPTQKEVPDERIRKQIYGKMRIIEQTNNTIFEIKYKNKKEKTTNPTTNWEERKARAEQYIRENMSEKLANKYIKRANKKSK